MQVGQLLQVSATETRTNAVLQKAYSRGQWPGVFCGGWGWHSTALAACQFRADHNRFHSSKDLYAPDACNAVNATYTLACFIPFD